jgi:membrane-bound lytic murein transglycosylase F
MIALKKQYAYFLFLLLMLFSNCKNEQAIRVYNINRYKSLSQILETKKLILGTTINPISFYFYRNSYAGFEYEIAKYISTKLKVELEVLPVSNDSMLYDLLQRGEIDLAANNYLSLNHSYPDQFSYTAPYFKSNLIAIIFNQDTLKSNSMKHLGYSKIFIPTNDLEHIPYKKMKDIYHTKYQVLLDDSSSSFELMRKLIKKDSVAIITWDYLLKLSNLEDLSKVQTFKINTDCNMSFLTSFDNHSLIDTVNAIIDDLLPSNRYKEISNRYFSNHKILTIEDPTDPAKSGKKNRFKMGSISAYDDLFKTYAKQYHFEWKLIAAIAFKESNFNPDIESPYGAAGLMQLMPETGKKFGADNLFNPAQNIKAGVGYLNYLRNYWDKKVEDSTQVMYFVIASYNSGQGHIIDAQKLAKKYGANPNAWFDNVELYLSLLMEPKYYKDPECKLGYCKATETINFVKNVDGKHQFYIEHFK